MRNLILVHLKTASQVYQHCFGVFQIEMARDIIHSLNCVMEFFSNNKS